MTQRLLALFFALLVLVSLVAYGPFLVHDHDVITSTPSAYTGGVQDVPLAPRKTACVDQILFDTKTAKARFGVRAAKGTSGAPLTITATGQEPKGYSSRSTIAGGWTGTRLLDATLTPPASPTLGVLCIRNDSNQPLTLLGRNDNRTRSRPLLSNDGNINPDLELPVVLLERERSDYLSRLGDIFAHAQVLQPLGTWWWWLLALLLAVAVPGAMTLAIRSATLADRLDEAPARAAPAAAPPAPWPSGRLRRWIEAVPGWAIVAAVAVVAFLFYAYWGIHTHVFQADEHQYVYLSRWLRVNFPESLWNFDVMQRGLQRLEVWMLAVPGALLDSPQSLVAGRMLNTIAFVSTAIPVYLLGRGMGVSSRWAALPAALSATVPWAVVTTSFLTENLAYPTTTWAIWAIWAAASAPSAVRDLLALVALALAGLSRTAMLLLVPLLPVTVLATELRYAPGAMAERLRTALRAHLVLWGAVAAGTLVLLASKAGIGGDITTRLAGYYGTVWGFQLGDLLAKVGQFFSRVVVGTAFFPAVVALPWLAIQLVRPDSRRDFALAVTLVGAGLLILYASHTAPLDERYMVYLAPLVLLPATVAVARRQVAPAGIAIATVLLALLLLRVPWSATTDGDFGYFVAPVESFYSRAVGIRLDLSVPGGYGTVLTVIPVALALGGLALARSLRRDPARLMGRAGAIAVAAVAITMVIETQYAISKFVNSAGSKSGPALRARAFADENTPSGARIGELSEGAGKTAEYTSVWQEVQFYNQRLDTVYSVGPNTIAVPPGDELVENVAIDPDTGRVRAPRPLPEYLVVPTAVGTVKLRGQDLPSPKYIPVSLMKVAQPATAAWTTTDLGASAVVGPTGSTVRFFGTGLPAGRHCATIDLGAPAAAPVRWSVRARRAGRQRGTLQPGPLRRVTLPLADLVERGHVDVRLGGRPRVLAIYVDQFC